MFLISVTAEVSSSESVDQLSCSGSLPSTSRRTTESCASAWSFSPQKCFSALPSPDLHSFSPYVDTGKPLYPPPVFSFVPPLTRPSCSRKHLILHTVSAACQGVILPSFSSCRPSLPTFSKKPQKTSRRTFTMFPSQQSVRLVSVWSDTCIFSGRERSRDTSVRSSMQEPKLSACQCFL